MATSSPPPEFHPGFERNDEPNTIVLISAQGTKFAVPLSALARVSQFFRTMSTIPQAPNSAHGLEDPLAMTESTETIHYVVAFACGLALPDLVSAEQINSILRAADKYDMPGLISVMRIALQSTVVVQPSLRYIIAARHGWDDIRDAAERACLLPNVEIDFDVPDEDFILLKPLLCKQAAQLQKNPTAKAYYNRLNSGW
ncbi:hypothetical protein EXIGLDRAFT_403033 [Exidia glandulosa HHB12029]|uniref:BTB domain-containing protein n=1 Tax=Exidia glandulosa HHB12029 TaxID=1314781 RepID=A0A165KRJ7_EXIGL|nr:hypothetical protein EXIGLDRAFT_403033 [Exidia glandulosa HHB12029]